MRTATDGFPAAAGICCAVVVFFAGCAVGPDYKRPAVDTPSNFRRAASDTNAASGPNTFADLGWWDAYDDPQLKDYIAEALTNNYDVKIAAARVLEAEAACTDHALAVFPDCQCRRQCLYEPDFAKKSGADPRRGEPATAIRQCLPLQPGV